MMERADGDFDERMYTYESVVVVGAHRDIHTPQISFFLSTRRSLHFKPKERKAIKTQHDPSTPYPSLPTLTKYPTAPKITTHPATSTHTPYPSGFINFPP